MTSAGSGFGGGGFGTSTGFAGSIGRLGLSLILASTQQVRRIERDFGWANVEGYFGSRPVYSLFGIDAVYQLVDRDFRSGRVDDPVALDPCGGVLVCFADDVAYRVGGNDLNDQVRSTGIANFSPCRRTPLRLARTRPLRASSPSLPDRNAVRQVTIRAIWPDSARYLWCRPEGKGLMTNSPSMYSPRTFGPSASYSSHDIGIRSPGCIVSVAMSYTISTSFLLGGSGRAERGRWG